MKVLLVNGSRRTNGCTFTALSIVAEELRKADIETEILQVGSRVVSGEVKETVAEAVEIMKNSDGLVIGSPVYYASPSGEVQMFLDRFFGQSSELFQYKPCACVTSARRAGTTAALEVLGKYPTIREMPLVASSYWPMVHGSNPEDVMKDEEGVSIMKNLGQNMAWLLKSIDAGKAAGIEKPVHGKAVQTNFIR